ncbi:uncharacterized protein C17orf98 [Callorhinchus milii]|uniref:Uncharacterized protein n=2 Tax=Callorhinchus milii TaxID=7868 RepID=A0A4W3H1S4_CALMI|nr:uncharacterized protein C17orf98 [Callorhinchus milii]|eukprot:gi/632984352/ref/XP_007909098.1/ PREDICTED: uncharacterized protein C17orf98 homolog [Callorhinchus milii]
MSGCHELELLKREKGFVLDGIATSFLAQGYNKVNPKLSDVIPPYNPQKDPYAKNRFESKEMREFLKKTNQMDGGSSSGGWVVDYFYKYGPVQFYLAKRNAAGAGHSFEAIGAHRQYLSDVKPMVGYSGRFGYRRTTPWLREKSSSFGEVTNLSLY